MDFCSAAQQGWQYLSEGNYMQGLELYHLWVVMGLMHQNFVLVACTPSIFGGSEDRHANNMMWVRCHYTKRASCISAALRSDNIIEKHGRHLKVFLISLPASQYS